MIPFNKPHLTGKETEYIKNSVISGKISGDGGFTKKCHKYFELKYGFKKVLLTTSCTDALEMCAILLNIKEGDEIIAPSFTFVSTVNAFVLRGAKIVFADSNIENPNIDINNIVNLVTPNTKAIIVVHYAGISCDMDAIMNIAEKFNLFVIEDAAQAIDSYYKDKPLGSIGHLATFSFHETKNVISGEGGMLVINDDRFISRAEIIREKGTNRSSFFRGEIDKYGWVDVGSSFLPSDIIAAFLFAQLENLEDIQKKRKEIWDTYYQELLPLQIDNLVRLPTIPLYATNNAHMFYIICNSFEQRTNLIATFKTKEVMAVFHYLPLHLSPYYKVKHDGRELPMSSFYADHLVRLPFYYDLDEASLTEVITIIKNFFKS